jgi:hypothetical protein
MSFPRFCERIYLRKSAFICGSAVLSSRSFPVFARRPCPTNSSVASTRLSVYVRVIPDPEHAVAGDAFETGVGLCGCGILRINWLNGYPQVLGQSRRQSVAEHRLCRARKEGGPEPDPAGSRFHLVLLLLLPFHLPVLPFQLEKLTIASNCRF